MKSRSWPWISPNQLLKNFSSSTGWLISLTLLMTGLAGGGIFLLNHQVEQKTTSTLLLTRLKEQLSRLVSLELEAIAQQEVDDDLVEELADYRENTNTVIMQLGENNPQNTRIFTLIDDYQDYEAKANEIIDEIDNKTDLNNNLSQDNNQTEIIHSLDDFYDQLYAEINALEEIITAQKQQIHVVAQAGISLSLALSASVISGLIYQFSRRLQIKIVLNM